MLFKEIIIPRQANSFLFVLGPCITLIFALLGWAIIPFGEGLAIFDYDLGIFYALAISSVGSYGILISGWAANSKYSFMGAIRSTAQLLSYELVFSSIILILILFSGSFSLTYIIECQEAVWNIFPLLPIALAFFITIVAETNRPPFDLSEAESELVAGLCEMWFTLYRWSWKTLFRANELILYKNNDLTGVVGIISNLYRKLIKYANKLMNPIKGSLCHKMNNNIYLIFTIINFYKYIIISFDNFYIWTSKIMNPAERLAPNIDKKLSKRNNLFLIESWNSIFKNNLLYYSYDIGETIARSIDRKINALEKRGKNKFIFFYLKYTMDEILLENVSVNKVINIYLFFYKCYLIFINYITFKSITNNKLNCTSTTITSVQLSSTHTENKSLNGRLFMELSKIYPHNDKKYRNLSKFLFNPQFLKHIYNKLRKLNLIIENIEDEWFLNTTKELRSGSYIPMPVKKEKINNTYFLINSDKNKVISEGIRVLLEYVYENGNDKFLPYSHGYRKNKNIHTVLKVIKNEWNDIDWIIKFDFKNNFENIHRKIIISLLQKNIQDQRLFDILNKLFNNNVCSINFYKSFDRYMILNKDDLSYFLINVFFHKLDKKIHNIKNDVILGKYPYLLKKNNTLESKVILDNNSNNMSNIRFVRYLSEFILGVKGPKYLAFNIKKDIDLFLKSDLHLEILNNKSSLINIRSDSLFIFNINISTKSNKSLKFLKNYSNIIQQQKKSIKIQKQKGRILENKIYKPNMFSKNDIINKKSNYLNTKMINSNNNINIDIKNGLGIKNKYLIVLIADINKIKKILISTGILDKNSKPIAIRKFITLDTFYIINIYNKIALLILNSFSCCDNLDNIKKIINYHIKWSLLHTLAAKHKSTIRNVMNEIYPNLQVKYNNDVFQYISKDQLKSIKINFSNSNSLFDVNWNNNEIDLYTIIKREDEIKFNKYKYQININKKFYVNKRYFSSYISNRKENPIINKNNYDYDSLFKNIYNIDYLINLYPLLTKNNSNYRKQYWNPNKEQELLEDEFLSWLSGFVDA